MPKFEITKGPWQVEVPPSSSGFGRAVYARREDGPDVFVAYVGNWSQDPRIEVCDAAAIGEIPNLVPVLRAILACPQAAPWLAAMPFGETNVYAAAAAISARIAAVEGRTNG